MSTNPAESPRVGSYVYCVGYADALANGGSPIEAPGLEGPVRAVSSGDLTAIVSDCSAPRLDVTRENLLAHERVVQGAMARSDVVPVAFGMVAASDDEVRLKLLDRAAGEIHEALERVQGCVQLNLKVFWKRDVVFAEIATEWEEICSLRDEIAGKSEDATYYERIRLGQLTARAIEVKSDEEAQAILDELEPLAADTQTEPNPAEMQVLGSVFLVEKPSVQDFDARVQAIGDAQADRLIFRYVGPVPPYNFVDVDLSWED